MSHNLHAMNLIRSINLYTGYTAIIILKLHIHIYFAQKITRENR